MHVWSSSVVATAIASAPDVRADTQGCLVAGAGAPVVMLHSSVSSKSQWTALAERLASRFRVVALDLCGYGDNGPCGTGDAFTVDDEVRLITRRLDAMVPRHVRVHLVGHSYGGLVAMRFAQLNGDRIASLSLYEPVVFRALDDEDAALADVKRVAERVAFLVAAGRRHDAAGAFVDFWSGDGSYGALPLPVQARIARRIDKVPLDYRAALSWPLAPTDIRAIVAPALLLVGNRSPAVAQRIVTRLGQLLRTRRIRWLDAGHMGPVTDAHRVNPWIEAFVDARAAGTDAEGAPPLRRA